MNGGLQHFPILIAYYCMGWAFCWQAIAELDWPLPRLVAITQGTKSPTDIANAGDGSGRIFIVEQAGRIRVLKEGVIHETPFLSIESRVRLGGEQGLLGVVFPPGFSQKQYFYVNYTAQPTGSTVVSRFRVAAHGNSALTDSEEIILTVPQPFINHNGGQIRFGPDGYLYIGTGDGGGSGDPTNQAQDPGSLLGKLLRINVEAGGQPYSIPNDNPFRTNPSFRSEIWALGLRNPWRFSFDLVSGDLFIGDVGQDKQEEIDFHEGGTPGGQNFGWPLNEGELSFRAAPNISGTPLSSPISTYSFFSTRSSVTGGFVFRGLGFPRMNGIYFFADIMSGRLYGLQRDDTGNIIRRIRE